MHLFAFLIVSFLSCNKCLIPQRDESYQGSLLQAHKKITRRELVASYISSSFLVSPQSVQAVTTTKSQNIKIVNDPDTYSAAAYIPQNPKAILLVLHGAGKNNQDASALLDIKGEHAGLAPSLLANHDVAPTILADNFIVIAPYVGHSKRSFYEEPRSKLLQFLDWILRSDDIIGTSSAIQNKNNIHLFGFSDGATVAVELATTRRFKSVSIAAYGFSGGTLPPRALQLLKGIPFWVFHSADDVIFPVAYSDRLVESLRSVNDNNKNLIRYTRYDHDQEGFTGSVQGHSTGITASKLPDLYSWMLSIP